MSGTIPAYGARQETFRYFPVLAKDCNDPIAGPVCETTRMSAPGTFETCPSIPTMSVHRGRPEVAVSGQTDAFDPKRKSSKDQTSFQDARDRVLFE